MFQILRYIYLQKYDKIQTFLFVSQHSQFSCVKYQVFPPDGKLYSYKCNIILYDRGKRLTVMLQECLRKIFIIFIIFLIIFFE